MRRRINTRVIRKYREQNPICEECGWDKGTVAVHHKIPVSKGGRDVFSNLKSLCYNCHYIAHFRKELLQSPEQLFSISRPAPSIPTRRELLLDVKRATVNDLLAFSGTEQYLSSTEQSEQLFNGWTAFLKQQFNFIWHQPYFYRDAWVKKTLVALGWSQKMAELYAEVYE